jgi:type I site-specific restriction endonuclease
MPFTSYIFRLRNPEDPSKPFTVAKYPDDIDGADGVLIGESMGDLRTAAYMWRKSLGREELVQKLRKEQHSLQELHENIVKEVQKAAESIKRMMQTYNQYGELISKIENSDSAR